MAFFFYFFTFAAILSVSFSALRLTVAGFYRNSCVCVSMRVCSWCIFPLFINMETERPMAKRHLFFFSRPFSLVLPHAPSLLDVSFVCFGKSNLPGDRQTGI